MGTVWGDRFSLIPVSASGRVATVGRRSLTGQNRRFEFEARSSRKRSYLYRFQLGPCAAHVVSRRGAGSPRAIAPADRPRGRGSRSARWANQRGSHQLRQPRENHETVAAEARCERRAGGLLEALIHEVPAVGDSDVARGIDGEVGQNLLALRSSASFSSRNRKCWESLGAGPRTTIAGSQAYAKQPRALRAGRFPKVKT